MQWNSVAGYEGAYEVSDEGDVRSLDRVLFYKATDKVVARTYRQKGRELSQATNNRGYKSVALWNDGKRKQHYVHRLVATAFHPNPDNLATVNHIDEVKTNNLCSNLEWMSYSDNNTYKGATHVSGIRLGG
ncbi:MAG: HNH endonuclease [Phaeodactylibacter sp.]|nr:HNH endonuclease [Phaeodactylibacter sp.]